VRLDERHATDHSNASLPMIGTASTSTCLQPKSASHPTPRPGHGTPDRPPVCCLAVALALARLPVIATRYRPMLAPPRLMSGFADRENEDPEELPMFEHRQHEV